MIKGIRIKDGEKITTSNIKKIIRLLEQINPITKKAACEILNISYNTVRLTKIIEDYIEHEEYKSARRKKLRGTSLSNEEKKYIISSYLIGNPLAEISDGCFRSIASIKLILREYYIPLKKEYNNYFDPIQVSIDSMSEEYKKGDLVYSAKYGTPAYIEKVISVTEIEGSIYRIRIVGDCRRYAVQPYYELADLRKLQTEFNIVLEEMSDDMIKHTIAQTLYNAKKRKNDD